MLEYLSNNIGEVFTLCFVSCLIVVFCVKLKRGDFNEKE